MESYYSEDEKIQLKNVDVQFEKITKKKLDSYFLITAEALTLIDSSEIDTDNKDKVDDFLLMAKSYFNDAKYFAFKKKNFVLAFGAINYAHAWLDAGARIGLFKVNDSRLFTVDEN